MAVFILAGGLGSVSFAAYSQSLCWSVPSETPSDFRHGNSFVDTSQRTQYASACFLLFRRSLILLVKQEAQNCDRDLHVLLQLHTCDYTVT